MPEEIKRTNVRLPKGLHDALKRAAIHRNSTIEDIIAQAIERDLSLSHVPEEPHFVVDRDKLLRAVIKSLETCADDIQKSLAPSNAPAAQFIRSVASRFLHSLPLPVLITALDDRIEWCNSSCEHVLNDRLDRLRGKNTKEILKRPLLQALPEGVSRFSRKETIEVRGVAIQYLCHRFIFSIPGGAYVGALFFGLEEFTAAQQAPVAISIFPSDGLESPSSRETIELIAAFLEHLPTSAVIKNRAAELLWCNFQYLALAQQPTRTGVLGKRFDEIFTNADTVALAEHERRVIDEGKAILASIRLSDSVVRTGVRFPIFDVTGKLMYVGGVGAESSLIDLVSAVSPST